ncbi:MAG: radical SAM protein, partial [bacterium]|nr:radical SAM protein [bacterium]
DVYACGPHLGDAKFCYGNVYEKSFRQRWNGKKRKDILSYVENTMPADTCMKNCRLDEINRYLWDLKHPSSHVNFI